MDDIHAGLSAQLRGVSSLEDAAERLGDVISGYCRMLREEPVIKDILSATQGDKNLAALDQQDSERNGSMVFDRLKHFVAVAAHEDLRTMCFMTVHLTGSLGRLASALDDKTAAAMERHFISSAKRDLMAFA